MDHTDASLLARLQEITRKLFTDLHGDTCDRVDYATIKRAIEATYALGATEALRRSGEALRRLQEGESLEASVEKLRQHVCGNCGLMDWEYEHRYGYNEAIDDVLKELRQSGAEGTEAGGREHPLAPTERQGI